MLRDTLKHRNRIILRLIDSDVGTWKGDEFFHARICSKRLIRSWSCRRPSRDLACVLPVHIIDAYMWAEKREMKGKRKVYEICIF
ncbi:hypothetical protein ACOSP7_017197 [Xanthoceras sorbifolium]